MTIPGSASTKLADAILQAGLCAIGAQRQLDAAAPAGLQAVLPAEILRLQNFSIDRRFALHLEKSAEFEAGVRIAFTPIGLYAASRYWHGMDRAARLTVEIEQVPATI